MNKYIRWILINIFLPLTPFLIRIFVTIMDNSNKLNITDILKLPELLFFSIYLCIINLNINFDGVKGIFESFLRLFIGILLVLDCIVLGMIYSENIGNNMFPYSIIASIFPMFIAPIYKFKYHKNTEE